MSDSRELSAIKKTYTLMKVRGLKSNFFENLKNLLNGSTVNLSQSSFKYDRNELHYHEVSFVALLMNTLIKLSNIDL